MNKLLNLKAFLVVTLLSATQCKTFAQSPLEVKFVASSLGKTIALEDTLEEKLVINRIRFYVGDLTLMKEGKAVHHDPTEYHLIDFEDEESMTISLDLDNGLTFDAIQFRLGTDSLSNASGALEGALDPMHGMYWTWNSGYINFKLEGTSPLCNTRKNEFRYHIGGYQAPHQTVQTVLLTHSNKGPILIEFDIDQFLDTVSLSDQPNIMQPGEKASQIAKLLPSFFSIK